MSLINKIKADLLQARKSLDKLTARLLTTLYSDCMKVGYTVDGVRPPSDSECLAVVKLKVCKKREGGASQLKPELRESKVGKEKECACTCSGRNPRAASAMKP